MDARPVSNVPRRRTFEAVLGKSLGGRVQQLLLRNDTALLLLASRFRRDNCLLGAQIYPRLRFD
jgi:hypothetical protein